VSRAKESVNVVLGGQRFSVLSDASEQRIDEVVQFVNERLAVLQGGKKGLDLERAALLVALNAAEELYAEREKHRALKTLVKARSEKLLDTLDAVGRDLGIDADSFLSITEVPPP
jgi:cell division protein ZapA (FtsZ GTPase activity inhibitor)